MRKRFIIFLIRRRLGLKKYERFRFVNQKSKEDFYFFIDDGVCKCDCANGSRFVPSSVSLNWLLSDDCEIEKLA